LDEPWNFHPYNPLELLFKEKEKEKEKPLHTVEQRIILFV